MKKILVVGIILLFLGLMLIPWFDFPIVRGQIEDSVSFTHVPANGLYLRHRFANYPVPFFLWYPSSYLPQIGCWINGSNISKVELWFPGIGHTVETEPPFSWVFVPGPYLPPFGQTKPWVSKVYMDDGQVLWDNLTVYRLF